jgi:hypothetical protein
MNKIYCILTYLSFLFLATSGLVRADQFMIEIKVMTAPSKWIDENQLNKSPKEVSNDLFKSALDSGSVDLLSAPRVTATAHKEAQIIIQEEPLAYMEKVGDGYQPRRMPEGTGPGIQFKVKMSEAENKPGHSLLDFSTGITTLSGRESVPLDLDVGKPIMQIRKYDSRIECFNDRWYFLAKIASFDADADEYALIFSKVQKVQKEETSKPESLPIQIVSDNVSFDSDKGVLKANGNVRIQEKDYVIYSDKLEFIQKTPKIKGPAIQADAMTLETPESRVRYSGNVRLRIPGGVIHSEEIYIQQLVEAPKTESAFEKKLKQTIIPNLSFKEVQISDAIDFLREMSAQHSPDGKRVEFVLTPQVNTTVSVTLELRNLSLYHVIRFLTQSCGQDFVLDEESGVILIF